MECLIDIINELEVEKEKLLIEKEENINEIKRHNDRIGYLKYVISQYNLGQKIRKQQIESYNRILDYKEAHSYSLLSLLSFPLGNEDDLFIESQISKLKIENEELDLSKKIIISDVTSLKKDKNDLKKRNKQIDLRILEIDKELDFNNHESYEKVYKLERGN